MDDLVVRQWERIISPKTWPYVVSGQDELSQQGMVDEHNGLVRSYLAMSEEYSICRQRLMVMVEENDALEDTLRTAANAMSDLQFDMWGSKAEAALAKADAVLNKIAETQPKDGAS